MAYPQTLFLDDDMADSLGQRLWSKIISTENARMTNFAKGSLSAFDSIRALPPLPTDIMQEITSFIPISSQTITKISRLVQWRRKWYTLINGRGGEGLHLPLSLHPNHTLWLRKNQQPKLRFSQPDFNKQIKERACHILFRQSRLCGDIETQLTLFVDYLIDLNF